MILCFLLLPIIVGATFEDTLVLANDVPEDDEWMMGFTLMNVTTPFPELVYSLGEEEGWIPRDVLFAASYQGAMTSTPIPQEIAVNHHRQERRPRRGIGKSRFAVTEFLKPPFH